MRTAGWRCAWRRGASGWACNWRHRSGHTGLPGSRPVPARSTTGRVWVRMPMPGHIGRASLACGSIAGGKPAKTRGCLAISARCQPTSSRSKPTRRWSRYSGRRGEKRKSCSASTPCSRPWPDPESQAIKSPITTSGQGWPGRPIIRRVPTGMTTMSAIAVAHPQISCIASLLWRSVPTLDLLLLFVAVPENIFSLRAVMVHFSGVS
ncbi:hypothetical protein ALQ65_02712 [Pseudomonas syringae pv. coriandricola]|uniref:Uncharacterized protein n=1 Tax=Pseudomonas syringae pv. coriandricola TaxID=264453 RepID=A0A0P9P0G1_9PSED|nr:Uncharacterized protein ALO76_04692 [Pseudomonas syringae pv. coriandricola]RMN09849.1 hypothetical protein ALQ65_02712 [Pseudomonas syringae pv. coriandricola]